VVKTTGCVIGAIVVQVALTSFENFKEKKNTKANGAQANVWRRCIQNSTIEINL
jgi:hypothetical protein